jgi:hypothetical protein
MSAGRNKKDRLAADFSEIQSSGLRSRGQYGNTVSNFESSPVLTVPMELLTEKIAALDISGWRGNNESELIALTKKISRRPIG